MKKQLYTFDYHYSGMFYIAHVYDCENKEDAKKKIREQDGLKRLPNNTWIGKKRPQ